jgi:Orsellinic acid/F9775 biosynthesis cluster protein D
VREPVLNSLGLVVDPDLAALCCEVCQIALVPTEVESHLKTQHRDAKVKVQTALLLKVCEKLAIGPGLPALPFSETVKQYAGLAMYTGIGCQLCPYASTSSEVMKRHYRNRHPTEPVPARWPSVDLQQLNRSSHKSFIHVKPLHVARPTEDELCLDQLYGELEELDRKDHNVAINARQISPWLLSTCWHEHIEGHDVSELRSSVATT